MLPTPPPDIPDEFNRGVALVDEGKFDEAIAVLTAVLAQAPVHTLGRHPSPRAAVSIGQALPQWPAGHPQAIGGEAVRRKAVQAVAAGQTKKTPPIDGVERRFFKPRST